MKLMEEYKQAENEREKARITWQAAHREMKQAERIEEKEGVRLDREEKQRETRELDELGSIRHFRK